jgi:hypothetical protein
MQLTHKKKKDMKNLLFLFALVIIPFTAFAEKRDAYEMKLISIEKTTPSASITESEESARNTVTESQLNVTEYSDSLMTISWMFHPTHLSFTLENTGNRSLKIIWDDVMFIDKNNTIHNVFHDGVKIVDREQEQRPTTIIKNTKLSDRIILIDMVEYSSYFNRWMFDFLFPRLASNDGNIRVLMPVQTGEETIEYVFTFEVKDLRRRTNIRFNSDYSISYKQ